MKKIAWLGCFILASCIQTGYEPYKSPGEQVDDHHIARIVKEHLHKLSEGDIIHVAIDRGIVQLSGFVATDKIKKEAVRTTFEIDGVGDVIDNIIVRSSLSYRKERAKISGLSVK